MRRQSLLSATLFTCSTLLATAVDAQPQPYDPRTYDPALREFDQRYYREPARRPRETRQQSPGAKYCSVYSAGNWRDTFPVPDAWTWSDCRDFAASVGAKQVHLVCIFSDGQYPAYSIGGPGDPPKPDCGWAQPQ
jgi:hypothetical protein